MPVPLATTCKRLCQLATLATLGAAGGAALAGAVDVEQAMAPDARPSAAPAPIRETSELAPAPADEFGEALTLPSAEALVEPLRERQSSPSMRLRARLEVESTAAQGGDENRAVQLLVKARRDETTRQTLIIAMWPRDRRGEALMIERTEGTEVTGFRFQPPDQTVDLAEGDLSAPLFGTSVRPDDLFESFWDWPRHATVGTTRVGRRDCWIVDSHAGEAPFPAVRSCLGVDEKIPLMIERFDEQGRLIARIRAQKLLQREEMGWVPVALAIESPLTQERATIRFTRSDRDVRYGPEDFTPQAVQALSADR